MFRKLLATTAIVGLMAGGAVAQTQPAPAEPAPSTMAPAAPADTTATAPMAKVDGLLATNIIGENVYNGTADNAENVGDVNDIVIDANGGIKSLIVGVGGFLGVGEKDVEVDYKTATWAEKDGDRWLVVSMTKEQLESAPAFDKAPYEPVAAMPTAATPTTPAAPADPATPPAAAPAPAAPAPAN